MNSLPLERTSTVQTCGCQSDVYKMPIQYCSHLSDSMQKLKETSENQKYFFKIKMVSGDDASAKSAEIGIP